MSRKSMIIIGVGLLVLVISAIAFNVLFNAIAPSEAELVGAATRQEVQALLERSQQAGNIRTAFYGVAALEVILTGILAFLWRAD